MCGAEVRIVGIDPGLTGAIVLIDSFENIQFWDTPVLAIETGKKVKNVINIAEAAEILFSIDPALVIIEKVQAMPGKPSAALAAQGEKFQTMGATSAFNFGMGYGIWLGILGAYQFPYTQVHPATWKKATMEGMGKEKDASRLRAMQLYPGVTEMLKLKKHHGRADALLLAHYGKVTRNDA
jgi:hypothetical protein